LQRNNITIINLQTPLRTIKQTGKINVIIKLLTEVKYPKNKEKFRFSGFFTQLEMLFLPDFFRPAQSNGLCMKI
jgi:hypothetical protein